ncbi:MAG: T9SS type A sorting domain-containing protein, partial [Flavobacteriales bacterium]
DVLLIGTSDASAAGASDGSVQATGQGGSNNYDVSVVDGAGVPQNPFGLAAGDYTVTVTDVTSGCEASAAFSISEPVVVDNPCDIVPSGLFVDNIIHNRVRFNWSAPSASPSHYMIRYRELGTSSWTVMTAGPVNSNEFNGTSRTRYFMEPGTTYQWSMRARVLNEDGSTNCQSSWSANSEYTTLPACANLENLSVSNVEANWVTFSADAPAAEWGVWQSKGKMRELGTNAYRYVNGGSDGSISGVLKGNFSASTDYEWHTKSWCTGNVDADGNPDPQYHSGWGDFSAFSTEAPCDKLPTNLTTSAGNNANTAVTMSWDTPESGAPDHYFLEMTNLTTGAVYQWNYQYGNSRTKYGQSPGDEISWRIRGACGSNGTSWATIFTQPVTFTLGGARLENNSVANLEVYPNPSRDIFNVTFTSEEAQTMTVKVVNMIGEEIFTEELTDFVGQYTKVIDMNKQAKGVYFLEIITNRKNYYRKLIRQ